ncbi:MAG: OmpA family protein [Planctomycetes bacterium]|nr:OmpA family protein [Planctomycetota bacterium]NOG55645.1 OmpA family protein [Planctomycetota bacterium]
MQAANAAAPARMRTLMRTGLMVAALGAVLSGCAPQERVDDLRTTVRALQSRNVELEQQVGTAQAAADAARQDAEAARQARQELANQLMGLQGEYDNLYQQLNSIELPRALPAEVDSALRSLASRYPDLMSFDSERGMIRLSSDLTFDLGSADVKASAASTIAQLANVLNSAEASQFEILVVGHTDAIPVSKPATKAKHPTNMHLSVHRAISVRDQLVRAKVAPVRMGVAGYGEFRPLGSPTKDGVSPADRRVEIFVLPRTVSLPSGGAAAPSQATGDNGAVNEVAVPMQPANQSNEPMK